VILVVDASFAAKVFLREAGTDIAAQWWVDDEVEWAAPTLIGPEVEAAIGIHHRNHPRVFPESRRRFASTTWANMLDSIVLHAIDRALGDTAMTMVQTYSPLRGADACYVAVAASLAADSMTEVALGSFDRQQRAAAHRAGLPVAPATLADG
jgi:predicted nucleic acid-binding protein